MAATVVRRSAQRRWVLVALLAAVLVAVPLVVAALPGAAATADPVRLRALVLGSASVPYQGYVESTGSLPVPDLPRLTDLTSLLSGSTRTRVWYRAPDSYRFAVLTAGSERDVYHGALGETVWDYGANEFTEVDGDPPLRVPRAGDLLPPDLARRALAATDRDPVSALPARRVAGVDAAGLRVTPADPATTVGAVDVWADPASGLPVRVEVSARGGRVPVLVTEFRELDRGTPAVDVVRPHPAPGSGFARVRALDLAEVLGAFARFPLRRSLAGRELRDADTGGVRGVGLYGTGLGAFVAAPVPRDLGQQASDAATKGGAVTTTLANGASAAALSIPPLTVVVAHSANSRRFYVLAGLVTADLLRTAATELTTPPPGVFR